MRRRPEPQVRPSDRRRVTLVTAAWGDSDDERRYALRVVAGALGTQAQVTIVHVLPEPGGRAVVHDGAFEVRRVAGARPEPFTQAVVLAALGGTESGRVLPAIAGAGLLELEGGWSEDVLRVVEATEPEVVLLGGLQRAWPAVALAGAGHRRVVLPMAGDDAKLELGGYRDLLRGSDVVGVLHRAEHRLVSAAVGGAAAPALVELPIPVRVNPAARRQRLVGLTSFDNYVLVLRGFPHGALERREAPDYEQLQELMPDLGVADVSDAAWRIFQGERHYVVPVARSRVNLWRLMAHALVTVDLRPGGLFGREVIESLLLGTPVVVPAGTPGEEVVERSGGGLVFADEADLTDTLLTVGDRDLRNGLAQAGEAWAAENHGDQQRFVSLAVSGLLQVG